MAQFALNTSLPGYLLDEQIKIEAHARAYGLDFFPLVDLGEGAGSSPLGSASPAASDGAPSQLKDQARLTAELGDATRKGYTQASLEDAWERYHPAETQPEGSQRHKSMKSGTYDDSMGHIFRGDESMEYENINNSSKLQDCDVVTFEKGSQGAGTDSGAREEGWRRYDRTG